MVAQPCHVAGEPGYEVDLGRVGLEVDEEPGLLRRADAGEVPQPLIGTVSLVVDLRDVVAEPEQHLVNRVGQLRHRPVRPARTRHLGRATTTRSPGGSRLTGDGGDPLKADVVAAEEAVADQVDAAPVLAHGMHVVTGEVAGHADQPGRTPQHLGRDRGTEPVRAT